MGLLRRHKVLTVAAVLLVVVLGLGWTVVRSTDPGPASIDDAVARFHDAAQGGSSTTPRPPAGVYTYEGAGREALSFPPLDQVDGASMPGTVTHGARGCWTFRLDFNRAHWQSWRYCPNDDEAGFAEVAGSSGQRWDLGVTTVGNVARFRCDPPNIVLWAATVGRAVDHRCTGTSSAIDGTTTSTGTWRFEGAEEAVVGGVSVSTRHFTGRRRLSGAQDGVEATEMWFRPDGLLIRYERDIEVRTDSPIGGAITYTESGGFHLTDLTPER